MKLQLLAIYSAKCGQMIQMNRQKVHASLPLDILKHEEISLLLGELRSHGSEIRKLKSMLPKIFMHLITSLPKTLFFSEQTFYENG